MSTGPSFTRKRTQGGLQYRFRSPDGSAFNVIAQDYAEAAAKYRRAHMRAVA